MNVVAGHGRAERPGPGHPGRHVGAGAGDEELHGDHDEVGGREGEKVADERRERERRRLEVEHERHAVGREVVPQRPLAVVDGQPVQLVPGHRLGDDVAVQVVVEDQVGHVGEVGELGAYVGGAEGRPVLQGRCQVAAHAQDDPGQADDVPPPGALDAGAPPISPDRSHQGHRAADLTRPKRSGHERRTARSRDSSCRSPSRSPARARKWPRLSQRARPGRPR